MKGNALTTVIWTANALVLLACAGFTFRFILAADDELTIPESVEQIEIEPRTPEQWQRIVVLRETEVGRLEDPEYKQLTSANYNVVRPKPPPPPPPPVEPDEPRVREPTLEMAKNALNGVDVLDAVAPIEAGVFVRADGGRYRMRVGFTLARLGIDAVVSEITPDGVLFIVTLPFGEEERRFEVFKSIADARPSLEQLTQRAPGAGDETPPHPFFDDAASAPRLPRPSDPARVPGGDAPPGPIRRTYYDESEQVWWIADDEAASMRENVSMLMDECRYRSHWDSETRSFAGVLLEEVPSEATAHRFGFRTGDRIIAVNGQPMRSPSDLRNYVRNNRQQNTFLVVYEREGERQRVTFRSR